MEILEESTWLAGVSATTPSYQIPDTGKLRFEVTVENASMRVESNEVFVWLNLKSETDDQWLELTTTGFRLKGKVTSYNARGYFKQAVFPSIDEFYYDLTGGQESDLRVYWQDNTLRIVSESPGEVTLHLRDLKDTYQFPAGGCVITDFADGRSSSNNQKQFPARRHPAGPVFACSGGHRAPCRLEVLRYSRRPHPP